MNSLLVGGFASGMMRQVHARMIVDLFAHIVREIVWQMAEWFGVEVMGRLGAGTARLISLGKWDVDEESWAALIIGWFVFVAGIVAWVWWGRDGRPL